MFVAVLLYPTRTIKSSTICVASMPQRLALRAIGQIYAYDKKKTCMTDLPGVWAGNENASEKYCL